MYRTDWAQIKKDGTLRKGTYLTKKKTPYHDRLHGICAMARSGEDPMNGFVWLVEWETKTPAYEQAVSVLKAKKTAAGFAGASKDAQARMARHLAVERALMTSRAAPAMLAALKRIAYKDGKPRPIGSETAADRDTVLAAIAEAERKVL